MKEADPNGLLSFLNLKRAFKHSFEFKHTNRPLYPPIMVTYQLTDLVKNLNRGDFVVGAIFGYTFYLIAHFMLKGRLFRSQKMASLNIDKVIDSSNLIGICAVTTTVGTALMHTEMRL